MVSFPEAIRLGFLHYFDFRNRSTRAEYWWWLLFVILLRTILIIIDMNIGTYITPPETIDPNNESGVGVGLLSGLFILAVLIPSLSLGARRLHDINRSGWWQLLAITGLGSFVLLVWGAFRSNEGTNDYGLDPNSNWPE